jgi:ankyrin repeat protein
MFAAQHGHDNIVRLLLDHGADPSVRGTHGKSASDLAGQNGHESTVQLLKGA